jgi:DNA invertase Pin-like site-specific DNA recombinase
MVRGVLANATEPADTTTAHGRLMLTVLGRLAEFERELIRTRTSEGRNCAKERGAHMAAPRSAPRIKGAMR